MESRRDWPEHRGGEAGEQRQVGNTARGHMRSDLDQERERGAVLHQVGCHLDCDKGNDVGRLACCKSAGCKGDGGDRRPYGHDPSGPNAVEQAAEPRRRQAADQERNR